MCGKCVPQGCIRIDKSVWGRFQQEFANAFLDAGCKELCMGRGGLKGKGFGKNDGVWWCRLVWWVLMLAFCAVLLLSKSQDISRCKSTTR